MTWKLFWAQKKRCINVSHPLTYSETWTETSWSLFPTPWLKIIPASRTCKLPKRNMPLYTGGEASRCFSYDRRNLGEPDCPAGNNPGLSGCPCPLDEVSPKTLQSDLSYYSEQFGLVTTPKFCFAPPLCCGITAEGELEYCRCEGTRLWVLQAIFAECIWRLNLSLIYMQKPGWKEHNYTG